MVDVVMPRQLSALASLSNRSAGRLCDLLLGTTGEQERKSGMHIKLLTMLVSKLHFGHDVYFHISF